MAAEPGTVCAAFGLDLDPGRFPDERLFLTPSGAARIEDRLAAEIARIGLEPDRVASRPRQRQGCLVRMVQALHRDGRQAEAAHLAAASGIGRPQVTVTAARAMLELRARDAAGAYIAGLEADPGLALPVRRNFLDLRIHNRLGLKPSDHAIFVPGEIPATLAEALARMPAPGIEWTHPVMLAAVLKTRGLEGAAADDFAARVDRGRAALDYLTFLSFYAAERGGPPPGTGGADNAAVHALAAQVAGLIDLPDPNPLAAAAAAGRGIVLTSAHAGLPLVAPYVMRPAGLPVFGISAQAATDLTHPVAKTLGAHGNFHHDFLRAIKILRRTPHVCQLMPDGGVGGELVEKPFRGGTVKLGPGAAVIAWQTRAAVFFFSTRWRDGRLRIWLRTGPVAEAGGDRAAFEAAFYDFYLGCLDEIVMGAPEDMAPGSGFWPALVTEEVKAAFRARGRAG